MSRRSVLAVGAAGLSAAALAACSKAPNPNDAGGSAVTGSTSDANSGSSSASNSGSDSASSSTTSSATSSATGSATTPTSGSGPVIAALSSVGIGSSIAAKDNGADILITRTAADTVVAFSAICPHQGCTVPSSFNCPCHGSKFDPKTGAHLAGPAPTGLKAVAVSISGDNIVAS